MRCCLHCVSALPMTCRNRDSPTLPVETLSRRRLSRAPLDALQFKGEMAELEELRELKEDVERRERGQAALIETQVP